MLRTPCYKNDQFDTLECALCLADYLLPRCRFDDAILWRGGSQKAPIPDRDGLEDCSNIFIQRSTDAIVTSTSQQDQPIHSSLTTYTMTIEVTDSTPSSELSIEVKQLCFAYTHTPDGHATGEQTLEDIDLVLGKGSRCLLIGANGCQSRLCLCSSRRSDHAPSCSRQIHTSAHLGRQEVDKDQDGQDSRAGCVHEPARSELTGLPAFAPLLIFAS